MPVITNKHGLPEEVYKALCSNRYSGDSNEGRKTDYSATTLIAPTQQTILKRRYPDANSEDAIDRVWSMFGSIAHTLLEEHGTEDSITEKRFYIEVLGKTISGQVDHYKDGIITDYKTTSAFKITKRSYDDWEKQLNVYAHLARANGLPVRNLRVIAIVRDWSERESSADYPKTPIVEIPLTLWDSTDTEQFILDKVNELINAETDYDFNLPICTSEEMWQSPTVYALMKEGRKTAVKLFDTNDTLYDYLSDNDLLEGSDEVPGVKPKDPYYVVRREGERRRCAKYCPVSSMCIQYQTYLKEITK